MVRVSIWTPKRFRIQLIYIMKLSAMLVTLIILFMALISSTQQFIQNPDYNAAHSRFTSIEENKYLNPLNNRSGFVLPHTSKIFPKGSRILPLFLISQSLSKEKEELERNQSNESHTLINTSTQINNETPILRNPENSLFEKSLENAGIRMENRVSSPSSKDNEYRMVTEESNPTLNEDEELKMTTEKQLNSKIVSKNDCYDENDIENGPTLEFQINVPVHLRIAKDRNGNGFNLKSIDLGQSKNKMKGDQKLIKNGEESNSQNLLETESEPGNNGENIVEKAVKHTEKPFSLVKFVSGLFHSDQSSRKKSTFGDEDEDLTVEQELFGQNGLFDAEETTSRRPRVGNMFFHDDKNRIGDEFGAKLSLNSEDTSNSGRDSAEEESFESARVIMPLWGEPRLPKDGSELWNGDGISMQNAQHRMEDLNSPKYSQRAELIELQPFFDRIIKEGNENYFPPRGVLSFM